MSRQPQLQVSCANCKQSAEVSRHLVKTTGDWPADQIHVVKTTERFVGIVHCPNCYHFTHYQRLVRQSRLPPQVREPAALNGGKRRAGLPVRPTLGNNLRSRQKYNKG